MHPSCPKCGLVFHFRSLHVCTGPSCNGLRNEDFGRNYFLREYLRSLGESEIDRVRFELPCGI